MASRKLVSLEQTEHLSWLAKVELSEEEKRVFTEQLNRILEFFRKLDEVDTSNVQPTYHVVELTTVFREDEPASPLPQEEALRNAAHKKNGYFVAPKIV